MEYIPEFKKGEGIHINPANKGKFTATKKKTGKSTAQLTHSKNPLTKKRAIFAQNAKKWHHEDGGSVDKLSNEPVAAKQGKKITKKQLGGTLDMNKKVGTYVSSEKATRAIGTPPIASNITVPNVSKKFIVPTQTPPATVPQKTPSLPVRPAAMQPLIPRSMATPNVAGLQKPQLQNPYGKIGAAEIHLPNGWPIVSKQGEEVPFGSIDIPGLRPKDKWTTQTITRNNWPTLSNALTPEARQQVNKKYNIDSFLKTTPVQPNAQVAGDLRF